MASAVLKVERLGRVLHLTLARPEKRNALSAELCAALVEAVTVAAVEQPTGAILLDAEGKTFSAGMDLDDPTPQATEIHSTLFTLRHRSTVPIIAAVQGPALGGGLGLVANAHVAITAQGAQFGLTEIRIGIWPFVIWPAMVAALGERRVMSLALTGRLFGTHEALQWGLVQEVVPEVELEDRAFAIAETIANASPVAVRAGLELARDPGMEALALRALELRAPVLSGPDFAEGLAAFREKRRPEWPSLK